MMYYHATDNFDNSTATTENPTWIPTSEKQYFSRHFVNTLPHIPKTFMFS